MNGSPIITLTTDYGLRDHYVSALKAMILSINRDVRLVDVSHTIDPQDIMAAAWISRNSAFLYPSGTIHVVIVDPGVGTSRKPIALRIRDQLFVGPDNGLFSLISDGEECEIYELSNTNYWGNQRSNTFHGRDIFAPVAAHLSRGVLLDELGTKVDHLVQYKWALPVHDNEGIQGWVMHIDHFGNLITNITAEMMSHLTDDAPLKIYIGNTILKKIVRTFSDVDPGEPTALIGSSGHLEVVVNSGNAAEMLSANKGTPISILFGKV